ncbi:MAG: hypothetical protein OEX19_14495 [Gammaproteobacteria bacterium]|nr:hypothetical protein [Gammaproteobacteria bacterium]
MSMNEILANPGVQAGLIPFIVSFVLAGLLIRAGGWSGLGILAGFIILVLLTTGIQFSPLTSTRKILLLILLSASLGGVLHVLKLEIKRFQAVFVLCGIAAMLWVLWPYLMRQELLHLLVVASGLGLFNAWMFVSFLSQKNISNIASSASISATGFGVGGAALLGASALLGQMGIAIGSAAFGMLAIAVLTKKSGQASYLATSVAGLGLGLITGAAIIYAKLPWYTAFIFMTIPVLARIGLSNDQSLLMRAVIWFGICMVPAALAIFLSWNAAGPALY